MSEKEKNRNPKPRKISEKNKTENLNLPEKIGGAKNAGTFNTGWYYQPVLKVLRLRALLCAHVEGL